MKHEVTMECGAVVDFGDSLNEPKTAKEKVIDFIDKIGNNLDSPYYVSKVLVEYGDELIKFVEELEKKAEERDYEEER